MAHPVTRAEEKSYEGGPVRKAAHSRSCGEVSANGFTPGK